MIVITVPMLPPASQSPNARCHWSVKVRERKQFMQAVGYAVLAAGVKDQKLERAKVQLEFVFAQNRRRDDDNLSIRGMKPIGDALVNLGVLVDDSSDRLTVEKPIITVDRKRAPATIIILEAL